MIRLSQALLIAAGSIAMTGVALAQDDAPPEPAEPPPTEPEPEPEIGPGAEPLTLYKGKILIAGSTMNINLSADSAGKPTSFAPSVWYGVNDKLMVGLVHDQGTTVWTPRPTFRLVPVTILGVPGFVPGGMGICVTGDQDGGCPSPYDNVGIDALYAVKNERLSLAVHPGLDVDSFDSFTLGLRLGVLGRYLVTNELSVVFDPRLRFGITERDALGEAIDLPVWVWYEINDKISAYFHTGINGYFEDFGDNYGIPLQLGGNYKVNAQLAVGLDFGFLRVNDSLDGRALGLRASYTL